MAPMQLAEPDSIALTAPATARPAWLPIALPILLFAVLSSYCAIRSEGFIAGDACTHYFSARHAFSNPNNLVDVWNRPLVTVLYAGPAWLLDREGIRIVSMLVAIGCGCVSYWIARGQGLGMPALALIFTLGQPMLFLHSFAEMTELPFALLLGLAFLAWQKERFWLAALLISWSPLARPEGFGIVVLVFAALVLYRRWACLLVLPIPVILWDIAGWLLSNRSLPWWGWLRGSWPYAGTSLYASGYLLTFVAMLPAVVSPFVLPAMLVGLGRSLSAISSFAHLADPTGCVAGRGESIEWIVGSEGAAYPTLHIPHRRPSFACADRPQPSILARQDGQFRRAAIPDRRRAVLGRAVGAGMGMDFCPAELAPFFEMGRGGGIASSDRREHRRACRSGALLSRLEGRQDHGRLVSRKSAPSHASAGDDEPSRRVLFPRRQSLWLSQCASLGQAIRPQSPERHGADLGSHLRRKKRLHGIRGATG